MLKIREHDSWTEIIFSEKKFFYYIHSDFRLGDIYKKNSLYYWSWDNLKTSKALLVRKDVFTVEQATKLAIEELNNKGI